MNSPRMDRHSDFDSTIGQELKSWAARQQAPVDSRAVLLAAARAAAPRRRSWSRVTARRIQSWLAASFGRRPPRLPHTELTQWLFTQAMWHNLGIDRRAVRFVC